MMMLANLGGLQTVIERGEFALPSNKEKKDIEIGGNCCSLHRVSGDHLGNTNSDSGRWRGFSKKLLRRFNIDVCSLA
jgi:hypothetical protein